MQTVWTKESALDLIARNDLACARALAGLYARQTDDEQVALATVVRNGRGFNARDARVLSDIARRLPRYGNRMTPAQLRLVRGRLPRYWRQILEMIEERGGVVEWPAGVRRPQPEEIEPDCDLLAERALEEANSAWAERQTEIDEAAGAWA